jgi:hypothetical protein
MLSSDIVPVDGFTYRDGNIFWTKVKAVGRNRNILCGCDLKKKEKEKRKKGKEAHVAIFWLGNDCNAKIRDKTKGRNFFRVKADPGFPQRKDWLSLETTFSKSS